MPAAWMRPLSDPYGGRVMTGARETTCRSPNCGAAIIFVKSATTGKTMVLDAKPAKGIIVDGPFMINGRPSGDAIASVRNVFTPHHATCPDAKAWAGRTRANPPAGS